MTTTIQIMRLFLLALLLAAPASMLAQPAAEPKKEGQVEAAKSSYKVKIIEIKHRAPDVLAAAVSALGSGSPNAKLDWNKQLGTITVRDYPENIAAIEEAIRRLDVPERTSPALVPTSIEFQIYLLTASNATAEKSSFPAVLEPVIKQLQATLKYANYRLITTLLSRGNEFGNVKGSGITDPLFPLPTNVGKAYYTYNFNNVRLALDAAGKDTIQIQGFGFNVSTPVLTEGSGPTAKFQYRDNGINTSLNLREGEMAVVGTANLGSSDEAMIVVVSARKIK
jgi:Bacterial type II/III secretion system short domain